MSDGDRALAAIVTKVALAADGAVLGVALAYVAARSFINYYASSTALRRIKNAPSVDISDLRSLLNSDTGNDGGDTVAKLVVVRGKVESKSAVIGSWMSLWPDVLVSRDSGEVAVVIQRSQKYVYNQWRGFFGGYPSVRNILARACREHKSTSMKTVPFVLVQESNQQSDYVVVDLDCSTQPLPLMTVYTNLQPMQTSTYSFLQALCGYEYPVGLLDEEKILPLGKDVNAVGMCSSTNGILEIRSCIDLPYFLSEMTKDQMVLELSFKTKIFVWSGIIVGAVSIGILGYAIMRNWNKLNEWMERRRQQQQSRDAGAAAIIDPEPEVIIEEEDVADVPDGQLCVICLMRRRRSAFVPCGHLVCCQPCALSVERDLSPKCPVCRQEIRNSVRIFNS